MELSAGKHDDDCGGHCFTGASHFLLRRGDDGQGCRIAPTVAVGHAILVICYNMIRNRSRYNDLGSDYFRKRNKDALVRQSVKRLEALGYNVSLEVAA